VKWVEDEALWVQDETPALKELSRNQERDRTVKRFHLNGLMLFLLCF